MRDCIYNIGILPRVTLVLQFTCGAERSKYDVNLFAEKHL